MGSCGCCSWLCVCGRHRSAADTAAAKPTGRPCMAATWQHAADHSPEPSIAHTSTPVHCSTSTSAALPEQSAQPMTGSMGQGAGSRPTCPFQAHSGFIAQHSMMTSRIVSVSTVTPSKPLALAHLQGGSATQQLMDKCDSRARCHAGAWKGDGAHQGSGSLRGTTAAPSKWWPSAGVLQGDPLSTAMRGSLQPTAQPVLPQSPALPLPVLPGPVSHRFL